MWQWFQNRWTTFWARQLTVFRAHKTEVIVWFVLGLLAQHWFPVIETVMDILPSF